MNVTIFVYVLIITNCLAVSAFIIAIIVYKKEKKLQKKLSLFCAGTKAKDLEHVILNNSQKIQEFDGEIQELFNISNTIHQQAHKGINKVGFIRYNPFNDSSGNQSFALALLNSKNNVVVISSIHTREGTRVYAKDILQKKSARHSLTEEEEKAIAQAR